MKYEHRTQPLLPRTAFAKRVVRHLGLAMGIIAVSLALGILGYHGFEGLPWLDATLNAAMILGGMGPVNPMSTDAGKLFASAYALFAGIVFLVAVGLFLAPVVHRFLHHLHLDLEGEDSSSKRIIKR